jgi:TatD DNase family protein
MIHVPQMRHLVGQQVPQHRRRLEQYGCIQAQHTPRRAAAPARSLCTNLHAGERVARLPREFHCSWRQQLARPGDHPAAQQTLEHLRGRRRALDLQQPVSELNETRTAGAAGQVHAPTFVYGVQRHPGGGKGFWRHDAETRNPARDPLLVLGEKARDVIARSTARHDHLDQGIAIDADAETPRANALANLYAQLLRLVGPHDADHISRARVTCAVVEWIDIGVNLTHESFAADLAGVLERARAAGLAHLVLTGTSIVVSREAATLAASAPELLASTAGVHPHHAAELDAAALAELRVLAATPEIVAVGECGLDYFRNLAPHEAQLAAFRAQLELAVELRKPVFLHERDAHGDFLALVREYRAALPAAVAHCFTGGIAEVEAYLELDLHIGVTGWVCDERRGGELQKAVPRIPAGRLMLETDAPYLLPRSLRPAPKTRRNEPAWLTEVGRVVAELRGESIAELAAHTTATARRFFGLAGAIRERFR